jgi:beta-lactamase class A
LQLQIATQDNDPPRTIPPAINANEDATFMSCSQLRIENLGEGLEEIGEGEFNLHRYVRFRSPTPSRRLGTVLLLSAPI